MGKIPQHPFSMTWVKEEDPGDVACTVLVFFFSQNHFSDVMSGLKKHQYVDDQKAQHKAF